ncbi:hypothetical protein [Gymnodinialimonas sp. 57CJ19]|uniref:hypothetical protein n=1 Tax=Gymnodinialimonas sp. 57CJ19 TaxID=3138498 RepID=UPI0031343063
MSHPRFEAALYHGQQTGDWAQVITQYMEAAEAEATEQGAAFYLTHAYVHALEAGDPRADTLKQRLIALGAEVEADEAPPTAPD